MSCATCSNPAVWFCECIATRLCDACFDSHCINYPDNEHQIVPISEHQETYSKGELLQKPELIQAKVEEELKRLSDFRAVVMEVLDQTCEVALSSAEHSVREWVGRWMPLLEDQRKGLESALEVVKTTRLVDKLPTEGYPWSHISGGLPTTFVKLPEDMRKVTVRFEDAVKVRITWDLPYDERPEQDSTDSQPPSTLPEATLEEAKALPEDPELNAAETWLSALPSDQSLRYSQLKSSPGDTALYFKHKFIQDQQWKLRSVFPSSEDIAPLETISVKSLNSKDKSTFVDLALMLVWSTGLRHLRLVSASFSGEDFELICDCISALSLLDLEFERCKLAAKQVSQLISLLPASVTRLNLSHNYFDISDVSLDHLQHLEVLAIEGMPCSEAWRQEIHTRLPNLVVQN